MLRPLFSSGHVHHHAKAKGSLYDTDSSCEASFTIRAYLIERVGNMLPEPVILFSLLTALVFVLSAWGTAARWEVQPQKLVIATQEKVDANGQVIQEPQRDADGKVVRTLAPHGEPIGTRSLLTKEGIYWFFSSMLGNFTRSPALGLIFVAMIGIGFAERFGFFVSASRSTSEAIRF